MQNFKNIINPVATPQSQPVSGKNMVQNNAGGFAFQLSQWDYLDRFLILGTEGGTYYVGERKLTLDACKNVADCIKTNGPKTVKRIVEISDGGRAAKNDPAIFALAMCVTLGDKVTKTDAYAALPKVCRIGTHLFHFMKYVKEMDGPCGHGFQRAVQRWYTEKSTKDLAYQVVKYQQRDGWSHRDVLRLVRPSPASPDLQMILHWAVKGREKDELLPLENVYDGCEIIWAFEQLKMTTDVNVAAQLIEQFRLPHECVPNEMKSSPVIWEALLQSLKPEAMLRNLNKLTTVGLLDNMGSKATKLVLDTFQSKEKLTKSRLHPMKILMAMKTYSGGHGLMGSMTWTPVRKIVDALNDAFYMSFGNVTPTGKRYVLALDISGSMSSSIAGQPNLSCQEGAFAMALVTANVEENYEIMGFSSQFRKLDISPKQRLDDILKKYRGCAFGETDCSLPMTWAQKNNISADVFCVYTDSETWAGSIHPFQALKQYRKTMGINAKSVVVGMSASPFTIADSSDPGMLDVVGFDTGTPEVISNFVI